ncbi:MAG: epimerase [Fimbriimonadaceae bacterium]|nr:epimerase [Fimbriimonadaceae bacterium]
MRILFIGGTRWVGHTIAQFALERGDEVTLFHRGSTPVKLAGVREVLGDRDHDLGRLDGAWDAVVDTCGYLPCSVRRSIEALKDRTGRYLFISSLSAVAAGSQRGLDENGPVHTTDDPWAETFRMEDYGGLKAFCERLVLDAFGDRALVVRPGLIVGPGDYSFRFNYWPVRFARGGRVVAPDRKDQPVQAIDVRDLGRFCLDALHSARSGIFNATGPARPMLLNEFLAEVRDAVGSNAQIEWVPTDILERHNVEPWSDLPLILGYSGDDDGMAAFSVERAVRHGLNLRPLGESARDALAEFQSREDQTPKAGLTPEREAAILADLDAWAQTC